MKQLLLISLTAILFSGCARFTTKQKDYSYEYDPVKGKSYAVRKVYTKATSTTFFESKSSLANFKASQTDKTQGATVGSLNQEASSTNLVPIVEGVTRGAVEAVIKVYGKP